MARSRILWGAIAMVAVMAAADLLFPDPGRSAVWTSLQSLLVFFLAALTGGWVARTGFASPALLVWALTWTLVAWLLLRIADGAGMVAFAGILRHNWVAIALSGAATLAGALCGQALAAQRPPAHPA